MEDFRHVAGYDNVNIFTYSELKFATKNFRPDQVIGEGGFGIVYKGAIDKNVRPGFEYTLVAVKVLNPDGLQGDREWLVTHFFPFCYPLQNFIGTRCSNCFQQ